MTETDNLSALVPSARAVMEQIALVEAEKA